MKMQLESDYVAYVPFEKLFSQWSVCEKPIAKTHPIQLARITRIHP